LLIAVSCSQPKKKSQVAKKISQKEFSTTQKDGEKLTIIFAGYFYQKDSNMGAKIDSIDHILTTQLKKIAKNYSIADLISAKREAFSEDIVYEISKAALKEGIEVRLLRIRDIKFSSAIEKKIMRYYEILEKERSTKQQIKVSKIRKQEIEKRQQEIMDHPEKEKENETEKLNQDLKYYDSLLENFELEQIKVAKELQKAKKALGITE